MADILEPDGLAQKIRYSLPLRGYRAEWKLGYIDGREQGASFSSGLTWEDDQACNESYDRGVNAGQIVSARSFKPVKLILEKTIRLKLEDA